MIPTKVARIAFVCTGNSCRSQIAEAWARHFCAPGVEVFSAGVKPVGINPNTVKIMQEVNIPLSSHTSKGLDALPPELDYVITVCESAARNCPRITAKMETLHWDIDDPKQEGTQEEVLKDFRRIREELREQVFTFLRGRNLLRKELAKS